jgi:hypothetical protein
MICPEKTMTIPHLHLILTHVPVAGLIMSFALLLFALWRKHQAALDIALFGILLSGVIVLPVFWSGEAAEEMVESLPGIAEAAVDAHEDAALAAAILAALAAGAALLAMVVWKRWPRLVRWGHGGVVVAALAAIIAVGWTANLGGRIRHPEIVADAAFGTPGMRAGEREGSIFSLLPGGKSGEREKDDDDDRDHDERNRRKHRDDD